MERLIAAGGDSLSEQCTTTPYHTPTKQSISGVVFWYWGHTYYSVAVGLISGARLKRH